MPQKSTLHDFTDVEPLRVKEKVPITTKGRVIAWAGPSNRDENVVVSHKHRFKYDDGKQDYFRKHGAYNYTEGTLNAIEDIGADRIAVLEVDNNRIIEYQIAQFWNSNLESHGFQGDGENFCVPVDDALHTWDRKACQIIKDHE